MGTLAQYMDRAGLSDDAFATIVGCSRTRISKLRRGLERPSLELAVAIERETGGEVRPSDFLDPARPAAEALRAAPTPTSPDPAALAAILDQLGGHAVVAEGSGVPVTDLEAMQAQGLIWGQYRPALVAFAREFGGAELDPARLTLRALGKDSPSWRAA